MTMRKMSLMRYIESIIWQLSDLLCIKIGNLTHLINETANVAVFVF